MRSASNERYYQEQFQLSQVYQDCWLTMIYVFDEQYKTLHLIAPSVDVFRMWDTALRKLYVGKFRDGAGVVGDTVLEGKRVGGE